MSAVLALAASLLWGGSDFMGGTASRRIRPLAVIAVSDAVVLVVLLVVAAASGRLHVDAALVGWGGGAGIVGLVGVLAFYRALADGTMGLVAPLVGLGVAVPVVTGIALGNRPDAAQAAGMAVAVVAVVAVSAGGSGRSGPRLSASVLALSAVAAVAFGTCFVCIDRSEPHGTLMTLLLMRAAVVAVVGVGAVRTGIPRVAPADLGLVSVIGGLDVGANACFALATSRGQLAVVSVLSSLYPAVTTLLARVVHDERLSRRQTYGIAGALVAVLLLAAGPSA